MFTIFGVRTMYHKTLKAISHNSNRILKGNFKKIKTSSVKKALKVVRYILLT